MSVAPSPTEVERSAQEEELLEQQATSVDLPWMTIVWNDPVNLMSYVTYVFETYFGHPRAVAEKLMMQVHKEGKAVVSHGSREEMERDVQAMHGYSLWATLQKVDA